MNLSYHIFSRIKIGEGGFGKVVLGTVQNQNSDLLHKLVAVKYIKRGKNGGTAPAEIHNLYKLSQTKQKNNHVVCLYDAQPQKRIVITPLYGPDLATILKHYYPQGILTLDTAAIAVQMLEAVTFCHRHSIVHLDVKPGNFVVSYNRPYDKVTLIDFGLSLDLSIQKKNKAIRVGSARYMSIRMHRYNTPRYSDDFYSIVYTLAMLRANTLPWRFSSITGKTHAEKHLSVANHKEKITMKELFRKSEQWFQLSIHDFYTALLLNDNDDTLCLDAVQAFVSTLQKWVVYHKLELK